MLQIGMSIGHVGNGKKYRLYGNASQGMTHRKFGMTAPCGCHGSNNARQGCTGPQKNGARKRLANSCSISQPVYQLSEFPADQSDDRCGQEKKSQAKSERPTLRIQ